MGSHWAGVVGKEGGVRSFVGTGVGRLDRRGPAYDFRFGRALYSVDARHPLLVELQVLEQKSGPNCDRAMGACPPV